MSFFEKIWNKKKEMAKGATIVAGGLVAGGAAAEAASSQAKPVEKTEQNIVSEMGMPSQNIDLQTGLNQAAEKDTTVKKLKDLIGPDSTFINKALADKWMNYFDNDEARVARLFSIFYEKKDAQEKKLKNAASKPKEDSGDEEEVVTRRSKRTGVEKRSDEEIFDKAKEELTTREANEMNEKLKTPEEKKRDEEAAKQSDIETAKENADVEKAKALKKLPDNLYDDLYSNSYIKILKSKYQGEQLAIKKGDYEVALGNLIDAIGAKIKAKGKVSIAEAGRIIKDVASQAGVDINPDGIAAGVDAMAAAGFVDGYTGSAK